MYKKYVKSGNIKRPYYYASIRVKGKVKNFYLGRTKSAAQKKEKELIAKQQKQQRKQSKIIHKLKTIKTRINYNKIYPFILIGLIVFGMSFFYFFKGAGITGLTVWETKNQAGFDAGNYTNTTEYSPDGFLGLTTNDTEQELQNNQFDELANQVFTGINMTGNVLLLHLNDESSYGENGTHVYDFSGNDNNGTFYNNVTTGVGTDGVSGANETGKLIGELNGSYAFDGDGDYISVRNDTTLNISDSFTIIAWVNPTSKSATDGIVTRWGTDGVHAEHSFYLGWDAGATNIETTIKIGSTTYAATGSALPLDQWAHIATTYDGSVLKLYEDGKETASNSNPSGTINEAAVTEIWIGNLVNNPSAYSFDGKIDEVAIFNRSLSAQEIEDIYDRQKGTYIDKGHYLSQVLDAGTTTTWNNINWSEEAPYGEELPADQLDEQLNTTLGGANMTGNILLLRLNNDSAYGENDTYVFDFSGHGNNGTADGAAPNSTHYRLGSGSFQFDGSNDIINITDNTTDLGLGTNQAFGAWIYVNNNPSTWMRIIGKGDNTNRNYGLWRKDNENMLCQWYGTSNANTGLNDPEAHFPTEEWHHVVCAYDGSNTYMYIDGVEVDSDVYSTTPYLTPDNVVLGYNNDANDLYFNGLLDEIFIFNRSLSAAEVLDIYRRGALRLNVSVRSCNDANCDGESWSEAYTSSPQDLSVSDNRYFQYRAELESYFNNASYTVATPELYNITVDHTSAGLPGGGTGINTTYTVSTNPSIAYTNDTLYCAHGNITEKTPTYEWYVNDVKMGINMNTLGPGNFSKGDRIYCEVEGINSTTKKWMDSLEEDFNKSYLLAGSGVGANITAESGNVTLNQLGDDSLVLLLNMDENQLNETVDASVNGNNGTLGNSSLGDNTASPTWTTGYIGSGLDFDGDDDFVNLSGITIPEAAGTFEVWFKPDINLGSVNFPILRAIDSSGTKVFDLYAASGGNFFGGWFDNGDEGRVKWATSGLNAGEWHHGAVTWTNGGTTELYIDGESKGTTSSLSATWDTSSETTQIGRDAVSGAVNYINGVIDELRILNRSLTAEEVYQSYIDQVAGRQLSLNDFDGNGSMTSQIFDLGLNPNVSMLSWTEEYRYGDEFDSDEEASTVLLMHFNNDTSDFSGLSQDGTLDGVNCTTALNGKFYGACEFDGVGDYIYTANTSNFLNSSGSFEFWMKPADDWDHGTNQTLFSTPSEYALDDVTDDNEGMVLLLHMNDNNSNAFNTTALYDWSGLGNNGTFFNDAYIDLTNYRFGGGALKLDGTTDDIFMTDDDSLSFGDGSNDYPFSISTWIYSEDTSSLDGIISKWNAQLDTDEWALQQSADGTIRFIVRDSSEGLADFMYDTNEMISANEWTHVVATYDGSEAVTGMKIYLDGVEQVGAGTTRGSYTAMENTARAVTVGLLVGGDGTNYYFTGSIDELAIWNRTLSNQEARALYLGGLSAHKNEFDILEVNLGNTTLTYDVKSFAKDEWHHVAGTYNDTGTNLYIDGANVNSTDSFTASGEFYNMTFIGAADNTTAKKWYFNGSLDEFRILNRSLTVAEVYSDYIRGVATLYHQVRTGDYYTSNNPHRVLDMHFQEDAKDDSGFGSDGTLYGINCSKEGYIGAACEYDGAGSYISIGNPSSLQITGKLTLAAWVKTDDQSEDKKIVSKDDATNRDYALETTATGLTQFVTWTSDTANAVNSTTDVVDDAWHHVVGVDDGVNLNIYVDGVLENTATSGGSIDNDAVNLEIGRRGDNSLHFNGTIDSVAVYNRALNASEIRAHYLDRFMNASGEAIGDVNRFVKYRTILETEDTNVTPRLNDITLKQEDYYLVIKNTKPEKPNISATDTPANDTWTTDNSSELTFQIFPDRDANYFNGSENIIGYWSFDSDDKNATTVYDSTVWDNDCAVLKEAACGNVTGRSGEACSLDGSDDYLDCADDASLTGAFPGLTMEAWVYPRFTSGGTNGVQTIIGKWTSSTATDHFALFLNKSFLLIAVGDGSADESGLQDATTNLANDTWYHVAGTWNSDRSYKLYVNGVNVASGTQDGDGINTGATTTLKIGAQGATSRLFNGTIDEVAIWNTTLSADEIAKHYENGKYRYELLISNGTDFSASNITVARLGINNFSEVEYYDDDFNLLVEHFESKQKAYDNNASNGLTTSATVEDGKFSNAFRFDAAGENLTYSTSHLNYQEGSIEVWVKMGNFADNTERYIFDSDEVELWKNTNNVLYFTISGNTVDYAINSLSGWNHFAATWKENENMTLVINGDEVNRSAVSSLAGSIGANFIIGSNDTGNSFVQGWLDELRISNIERTPYSQLNSSSYSLADYDKILSDGVYYWKVRTTDEDRRNETTDELTFSDWSDHFIYKVDTQPPSLAFVNQTDEQDIIINETTTEVGAGEDGENVTIRVEVTDAGSGIDKVWIRIWETIKGGAIWFWDWLTNVGSNIWEITFNVNASWNISLYNYTVYANDSLGFEVAIEGNISQCSPPSDMDWNITLVCNMSNSANLTVAEDYNLSILDGGHLILENTTVLLNPSNDINSGIRVFEGGKLDICCQSNITTTMLGANNATTQSFFFSADSGSNLTMRDSFLSGTGWGQSIGNTDGQRGLEINTKATIENNNITHFWYGISLWGGSNESIIYNNTIDYSFSGQYGIYVNSSNNGQGSFLNISHNNMTAASGGGGIGIYLENSFETNITNNTITAGWSATTPGPQAILVASSENCTFSGNVLTGANEDLWFTGTTDAHFNHSVDASNYVRGINSGSSKPVLYLYDSDNYTLEGTVDQYGSVLVAASNNITIQTNEFYDFEGIHFLRSVTNSTIDSNYMNGSDYNCKIVDISGTSENNTVSNNTIETYAADTYDCKGIYLAGDSNLIYDNNMSGRTNLQGIYLDTGAQFNLIDRNNITCTANNCEGLYFIDASYNNFSNNNIDVTWGVSGYGLHMESASSGIGDNRFVNDTISGGKADIHVKSTQGNSPQYFVNSSWKHGWDNVTNDTAASSELLYRQWYLAIYVNDTYGTALDDANVSIFNRTDDPINEELTSSGAITIQELTEYIYNHTATFYTNYTINTSKTFYNSSGRDLNLTSSDEIVITLTDADPPHDITLDLPDNSNFTASDTVDFNWTALDHLDTNITCNLTLEGVFNGTDVESTNGTTTNWTVVLPDALYEWNVSCWDDENQVNTSETRNVTVDTTGPVVGLDNPADFFNETASGGVVFNFTANDTYSDLDTCELWGNWTSAGWHLNESFLNSTTGLVSGVTNSSSNVTIEDGLYVWSVYCNDSLGNSNTTVENRTLTVDTAAPVVGLDNPVDFFNETASGYVMFNFTANDTHLDTCELWGNWTTGWHLNETFISPASGVTNGSTNVSIEEDMYVWSVYCNDTFGHSNTTVENRTLTVDTAVPVVNIDYPVNGSTVSAADLEKDFNFSITESNLVSCWYELNSSGTNVTIDDCAGGNRSVRITLVKAIWNNITIWVKDIVDNEVMNRTFVFTNTAPPVPSLTLPLNNSQHLISNLTFQWANVTDDDGDAVTFDINITNDSFIQVSLNESIDGLTYSNETLPDGWHYWTVRAYDSNDYSAWNGSYFYVDVVNATITISSPSEGQVLRPGNSLTVTGVQNTRSDWVTNFSIFTVVGGVETDCGATNDSVAGDSSWSCTYSAATDASTGIVNVVVYAYNRSKEENVSASTYFNIVKATGPAVAAPRIVSFYPNVTYANSTELVGVTLDLDLDVLNKTVTVTVMNSSTENTLVPDSIVADDTNFDYVYNYSFLPSVVGQTYNFSVSVSDQNDEVNSSSFLVWVKTPVNVNLSTVGGTDIRVKDINSGMVLTSGTAVDLSFVPGEYDVDIVTSVGTVTLFNSTLNVTAQRVLEYVDKDESASIPSNTLGVDRFVMSSEQLFSNDARVVYDYSNVSSSVITESNLKVYKCVSEASCTWGEIDDVVVDSVGDTVTATFGSFSVFLVAEDIATLTATSAAAASTGGGASLQKASVKIVTPAALTANPLKMLLEDRVSIPIQIKNNGNKPLSDVTLTAVSESSLISLDLDKTFIRSLAVGASEIVMATVTSALTEPGVYTAKLTSSAASPAVSDDSELIIAVVSIFEEKVEQIITRVVFAKDLFKEHPECLELQELLGRADKAIQNKEYEKARTLTETAILGCQDMITALTLKREVPGRLPFTKQQIIILIVVISSALALLLYLITSRGFGRKTFIKRGKTREKRKTAFKLPTFKFGKKKAAKKKVDIWKRR